MDVPNEHNLFSRKLKDENQQKEKRKIVDGKINIFSLSGNPQGKIQIIKIRFGLTANLLEKINNRNYYQKKSLFPTRFSCFCLRFMIQLRKQFIFGRIFIATYCHIKDFMMEWDYRAGFSVNVVLRQEGLSQMMSHKNGFFGHHSEVSKLLIPCVQKLPLPASLTCYIGSLIKDVTLLALENYDL